MLRNLVLLGLLFVGCLGSYGHASHLRSVLSSLNEPRKQEIREIVSELTYKGMNEIINDRLYFDSLIQRINRFSPDEMLSFIFSDSQTRECIRAVSQVEEKFVLFSLFLLSHLQKMDPVILSQYTYELADFLRADANVINEYIRKQDTRSLISYLLMF